MVGEKAFEGWTPWRVGCHWSRDLPDGRSATLSTWQNGSGSRGGYTLSVEFRTAYFDDLEMAKATYNLLAEGRIAHVTDAPGGRDAG
jgi:hypothetical protein